MTLAGYVEYQRREYCREVLCPVQLQLKAHVEGSPDYERIRQICQWECKNTAWEFHRWLIVHAYAIVRPNTGAT